MTPEEIKAKRKELVEWEINNRTSANRCVNNKECCVYSATPTSPGCAIGRLLPAELAQRFDVTCEFHYKYLSIQADMLWFLLPEELKALGDEFLGALQRLHDQKEHWIPTGLSSLGKTFVKECIKGEFY